MWYCNNKECNYTAPVNPRGCICPNCFHTVSREITQKSDALKLNYKKVVSGERCASLNLDGFNVFVLLVSIGKTVNVRCAITRGNPYDIQTPRYTVHKTLNSLKTAKAFAQETVYNHFINSGACA